MYMAPQKLYPFFFTLFFICPAFISKANNISDSVVKVLRTRFEQQHYKFEKVIIPDASNDGIEIPTGNVIACYSGKEVLVIALFDSKPGDLFGRMLVSKKHNGKIEYDKHLFQDVGQDYETEVYYSLLNVLFPDESNSLNCNATLQIYDKKNQAKAIRLLIFTK